MKIGIIGCGYVGKAAAHYWKHQGHTISVTTRSTQRIQELELVADTVFVLLNDNLSNFIDEQEALLISIAPDRNSDYSSTYLKTACQVSQALQLNSTLKYLLYTSSSSVYGNCNGSWVDETAAIIPTNENIRILHETEQVLLNRHTPDVKTCIFRLGEIYGPDRCITNRLQRMQGISVPGNGQQFANLISLEDIVRALDFALSRQLHGIYNLCNDMHPTREQLYQELCEKEGLQMPTWDSKLVSTHSGNKKVSNEKMKQEGFIFSTSVF